MKIGSGGGPGHQRTEKRAWYTTFAPTPMLAMDRHHTLHRMLWLVLALACALPALAQKRKGRELPVDSVPLWIQKAAELERMADNAGAEALLSKAYLSTGNTELLKDRTRVRQAMGDSIGSCSDLRECQRYGEDWKARYQGECVRKDSTTFTLSGFSAERFPGMRRVRRVRYVEDPDPYVSLIDAGDTVRVGLVLSGNDTLFTKADRPPAFPDGPEQMYAFMAKLQRYPAEAADAGIQGKVYIEFSVLVDGRIAQARIKRSAHPALDAEALRLVNEMPAWTPGSYRGRPVPFRFVLPVKFTLR